MLDTDFMNAYCNTWFFKYSGDWIAIVLFLYNMQNTQLYYYCTAHYTLLRDHSYKVPTIPIPKIFPGKVFPFTPKDKKDIFVYI